jgi:MraZ protein
LTLFLSNFVNKMDRKNRVSVPASFRAEVGTLGFKGVVLFRSSSQPCLEGFTHSMMTRLAARLDHMDLFSPEQDDLATAIFADSCMCPFDNEGRILLPDNFITHARIEQSALFVGLGRKFQIWNEGLFEDRLRQARNRISSGKITLPSFMQNGPVKMTEEGGAS